MVSEHAERTVQDWRQLISRLESLAVDPAYQEIVEHLRRMDTRDCRALDTGDDASLDMAHLYRLLGLRAGYRHGIMALDDLLQTARRKVMNA